MNNKALAILFVSIYRDGGPTSCSIRLAALRLLVKIVGILESGTDLSKLYSRSGG
jgi:hypothetical protein